MYWRQTKTRRKVLIETMFCLTLQKYKFS